MLIEVERKLCSHENAHDNDGSIAVTGRVQGRVQRVSFRYSMQQAALDRGVFGWVRNLPDRSVAFHIQGRKEAVDAMVRWCRSGPAFARVDLLDVEPAEPEEFHTFEILT